MADTKEKKYIIDNPALMAEWNWEKNDELRLNPTHLSLYSNKKAWWKCLEGHEWQATIANRSHGKSCPYCSGRNAIIGKNDLLTVNPALLKEWNYEKNRELKLENYTAHSSKIVWWKCAEEHEWTARIADRSRGNGCPYCAGKKVLPGYNDLGTVNSKLANEWNFERNVALLPENFTGNSSKKVWWRCQEGHEWEAVISSRNKGVGCPYCSGKRAITRKTDLNTVNPLLAAEWNYEKNGTLTPDNLKANSNKKVWWKCSKGHEWQAVICSRNKGIGCPICTSERSSSFPEYILLYYLRKSGLEAVHSYKSNGYELDVFIPAKRIAIEYDGYFWHKAKRQKDLEKNKKCQKDGIFLYRIREGLFSLKDSSIDYVVRKDQKDLPQVVCKILKEILGVDIDINLGRDFIAIENLREYMDKEYSLLTRNPQLAKEWNYEKNGKLKPENFTSNSGKKVWWKCSKGHEWEARINSRNGGSNCPYCSGRYAIKGKNDLETVNPALAKEWNYEKNKGLTPAEVTLGSGRKVWWKCRKNHEWQATINSRGRGNGCPYCSGQRIDAINHLQAVNPSLAREWNCKKNNDLTPSDVTPNSGKKVWWRCAQSHEWQATIASRSRGNGCPYCAGKKVLSGYNDLQTINPILANEWDFEKNHEIVPAAVSPHSHAKVWWKCSKGHEWQATINNRNYGYGCPYCAGQKVSRGVNDLQTVNPLLAEEWNYEKNNGLTPFDIMPNSNKKAWWKCSVGHEWQAAVYSRTSGTGCPYCYKESRQKKYNDR